MVLLSNSRKAGKMLECAREIEVALFTKAMRIERVTMLDRKKKPLKSLCNKACVSVITFSAVRIN